jgi:hypothetical protein
MSAATGERRTSSDLVAIGASYAMYPNVWKLGAPAQSGSVRPRSLT